MDDTDRKRIEEAAKGNFTIRKLYAEHRSLDKTIESKTNQPFLTSEEEQELRVLKRRKLFGKDRLMTLVNQQLKGSSSSVAVG